MIGFTLIALSMVAIAILGLALPLLGRVRAADVDRRQQNVAIAREQLAALDKELAEGVITAEVFAEQKAEVERNLLSDVDPGEAAAGQGIPPRGRRWALILVGAFTLLLSTGLYLQLGSPEVMQLAEQGQPVGHGSQQAGPAPMDLEQSINKLKARLFDNPEDLEGWFLLSRSYMAMGRYQESADAMAKVYAKTPKHAGVILGYADALAMANEGRLSGKPFELVQEALKLEPNNVTGLWLAGLAYEEQGKLQQALDHFRKVRPMIDNPESQSKVDQLIARMEGELGMPPSRAEAPAVASGGAGIEVVVMASEAVLGKLSGDEQVFIYAKAMQGPPMPLAAQRISVRQLPITIRLDDSMAMLPQMKLSNFAEVKVGARISKSGNAIAQKGDFYKEVSAVKSMGNEKVTLIVDGVVE